MSFVAVSKHRYTSIVVLFRMATNNIYMKHVDSFICRLFRSVVGASVIQWFTLIYRGARFSSLFIYKLGTFFASCNGNLMPLPIHSKYLFTAQY